MLIFVKKDTPEAAIRSLVIQLSRQGIGTARADSAGRTMLTLVGETWTLDEQRLLALPYVAEVKRLTPVWRLASRQTHPEDTVVSVGDAQIGKGFCLMAGPCAVESALQMQGVARAVKAAGGLVLRGGAYKPRTSPYAFQGFGAPALELLAQTGREVGLPTVSEITDAAQLPQFEQVDMLQVGARNMQNYELLRALGQQSKPVLLKRAVGATVEELLQSAEYILAGGNPNVVLCERGGLGGVGARYGHPGAEADDPPAGDRGSQPRGRGGSAGAAAGVGCRGSRSGRPADRGTRPPRRRTERRGTISQLHRLRGAGGEDQKGTRSHRSVTTGTAAAKRYTGGYHHAHVHVTVTGKHTREWKQDLMDFAVATIHANTSTPLKNVYVYIHEMDPENVRKTAPIVRIDWTTIPDRTQQAKNAIMTALSYKLAEITGENKMEINGILINDIPLACGMLGGISRADNCDW